MASIWVSEPRTICSSKTQLLLLSILLLQELFWLDDGHRGVVDPSLLEQDNNVDMQSLLENLKGQFLQTFNLSGSGPSLSPGNLREEPPEYMMELYNHFANDHNAMPSASIIRSFKNEGKARLFIEGLMVAHHERITAAELRIYTLVQTDCHLYAGIDRKVTIYEIESNGREGEQMKWVELASRQVYGTDNGWQAFDLTAAVQRWHNSDGVTTHRLEVHIASMSDDGVQNMLEDNKNRHPPVGDMKVDTRPEEKHKPLLIVFLDDQSSDHRHDKCELNEMIDHETSNIVLQNNIGMGDWSDEGREQSEPDEEDLIQMRSNLIFDSTSRIRRNAKVNHCKKQSLYVEFKDIGWDSWILAPPGYDAYECTGVCSFPLTKHVTPTKHAIVQTLVNINSPQKAARACCVPTKLDPISLLYLDETGVVTYKYKFEGMVVAECDCR
uniref:Bone morphogenetic protein 10 n=1 Tax=Cynoglossus semilaevis TaxID=244447 RepID=A0A3P8VPB2_CYNSE